MQPTDIAHLTSAGRPSLAPDGRTVVIATSRPDLDEDEYRSHLWIAPTDGSTPPRQLTRGAHDNAPRYSPDGRWIAFLRTEGEGKPQLHVLPTDGGDARAITKLPGGAGAPVWSPDSSTIAFSTRVPDERRYGRDEKITPDKEAPRRITGLQYRLDGVGFTIDKREQVFVVAVAGEGEPRQITSGQYDSGEVSWSPDGTRLAFVSARHDSREHDLNSDVFVIRPDGSELRQVTDTSLWVGHPVFTPAGDTIVFRGVDPGPDRGRWFACQQGLFSVPAVAGGRPRRLTDAERFNLDDTALVVDGELVLALYENRGAVDLISIPLDGTEPTTVSAGQRQITGFDLCGGTIAVSYQDDRTAGELGVLRGGEVHALSDFAATLREHATASPIIELTSSAPDGQQLHGFLVLPEGDGPHPVLLMIHGGPFTQYGWTLFDEAQVYAGAGYAVVYTNPRGSSGYGAAYGAWIRGEVGERSGTDLLAMLDDALVRPDLDETRVGVLGGSHGGYMTSWLVGHHSDRFRAAVSERAVNAIDSFGGSSDIGWGFGDDLYALDEAGQKRLSPLTYADEVSTPLLIIHSEHDWRCPLEQAQRMYVALRKRDAEVEMLLFPGEGHELSRSGLPSHRVARFEAIVEWFDRHLRR
ncbi:MAG: S9 family peptidase [Jatrophihabitantaceae bacterium]